MGGPKKGAVRKSASELERQEERKLQAQEQRDKARLRLAIVDKLYLLLRSGVFGAVIVLCVYFGIYKAAGVLAGTSTSFSSVVKWMVDLKASQWVAYILGGVGTGAAIYQRRTNRKLVKRFGPRISELESHIDPGRSSSNLLPDGTPRKQDIDD